MFICKNCDERFDEPKRIYESHGLDSPPYERLEVCPRCFDTSIIEAVECKHCGEWIAEDEDEECPFCHGDLYEE